MQIAALIRSSNIQSRSPRSAFASAIRTAALAGLLLAGSGSVGCTSRTAGDPAADRSEVIVAVDIGHSQVSPGATSARGKPEFELNQAAGTMLVEELRRRGYSGAFLINEAGADVELRERTLEARRRMADLFISIHHDSVQPHYLMQWEFEGKTRHYSDVFRGFSVFYSGINGHPTASARFAKLVGEELVRAGFAPTLHHAEPIAGENRELIDARTGVYRFDELVVLRTATMPAVLIECGVIVNREEELHVSTAEYRRDLVAAVANAVDRELINAEPGNDSR